RGGPHDHRIREIDRLHHRRQVVVAVVAALPDGEIQVDLRPYHDRDLGHGHCSASVRRAKSSRPNVSALAPGSGPAAATARSTASGARSSPAARELRTVLRRCAKAAWTTRISEAGSTATGGARRESR